MKTLPALAVLFTLALGSASSQSSQSLALPSRPPVACSAQTGCFFMVHPNTTAVLIGRFSSEGMVTGSLGETWTRDQCVPSTGNCAYHANFGAFCPTTCTAGDKLTFSGPFPDLQFSDVLLLLYDGTWNFDAGNFGTYASENSVFPDCSNGNSCPYAWTLPIETEAGALIIGWGEAGSLFAIRPGPGFTYEGKSTYIFAEDMIAPATGVYIGSWMLRNADGSESGGAHWLAGVAAYKKGT